MSRLGALATAVANVTKQPAAVIERVLARAVAKQKPFEWERSGVMAPDQRAMLDALRKASEKQLRTIAKAYAAAAADDPAKHEVLTSVLGSRSIGSNTLALFALFGDASPLDLLRRSRASIEPLRARARTRYAIHRKIWKLDFGLGAGFKPAERLAAARLFAILALPCNSDEEVIRLAVSHTGPGSEGYDALLACATHLRTVHRLRAPSQLDRGKGWDGGGKEKVQGIFEVILLAMERAPSIVPELVTTLFAQSWSPKRMPGLWLALAEHFEDHVA